MGLKISVWIFVIFAGLLIVIDTKHHSKKYHHRKNDLYDSDSEEYRPHRHHSRKHHDWEGDSESREHYGPQNHRRTHMDLEGRALKPPQSAKDFKAEALKLHNSLRAAHGAPPLQMDNDLNDLAEGWAKEIGEGSDAVKTIVLSHNSELTLYGGVGDNIFGCKCRDITGERATNLWYSEEKKYNYSNPHYHWTWGHFTQVVWKETNKFGIAKYKTPIMGYVIVVATYAPRGNKNYTKSFKDNVLPKNSKAKSGFVPSSADDKIQGVTNNDTAASMPVVGNTNNSEDNRVDNDNNGDDLPITDEISPDQRKIAGGPGRKPNAG